MADNKKYYYMRLKENFFDSEEMVLLESMKDGVLYSNILIKMYLKSLKSEGRLMFKDTIPYNPQMIATITRHHEGVVEKALQVFEQLGLIEVLHNGAIYMMDIELLVGKTSTEGDRKLEARRKLQKEKEQLLIPETNCGQTSDVSTPELEIELEIELENKDIKETSAKPPSASKVKYEESNPYYQLANYLYQSILKNDPKAKQPNMQTWSDEIRKLVELDERDIMDVKDIVTFATNHHFWKKNILSTKKLRDKFSTLYIEFNDKSKSYGQKKYQQPTQQVTSKEVIGTDDINHPNYNWANYRP